MTPHDVPPLAGYKEACEILKWEYPKNRTMINTYMKRGQFPIPVQVLASGPIWTRAQIEEYGELRARKKKS